MVNRFASSRSRIFLLCLSLALAFTAQFLFTGEVFTHFKDSNTWAWKPEYSIAIILLLLAIGCATLGFFPREAEDSDEPSPVFVQNSKNIFIWILASGLCYLLSLGLYMGFGETVAVDVLWMAGIGLLIFPFWIQQRGGGEENHIPYWEWILVIIITLIGFGLRYWNLLEIPSHVDNDIALMGTYGLKLIQTGDYRIIGFSESQHLLSYDQWIAWSMRLFGQNQYGVVMFSVVFGTLTLPIVFLLGRELGGRLVGWTAIAFQTISYTHIHFSRILFGSSATFAAVLAFYFFLRGMRTRNPLWFGLAGTVIGLGLLIYDSSRVLPVIALITIGWVWLFQRKVFHANRLNFLVFFFGILIGFGPMLGFSIHDFSAFVGRGNAVMLWTPMVWAHEMVSYHATNAFEVIWGQTWRTFLTLHLTGDGSPHFSLPRPMTSAFTAAMFTIGIGYCLPRLRQNRYILVVLWFVLVFILGGVLTYDPPYWPHLNIVSPAVALIASLGVVGILYTVSKGIGRKGVLLVACLLMGAFIWTGITNWQMYINYVQDNAGPKIRISRFISFLPKGYRIYLLSNEFSWNEYAFRFFNKDVSGEDITIDALLANHPVIDQPIVFIIFNNAEAVTDLQRIYPTGKWEEHFNNERTLIFNSFAIIPDGYTFPDPQVEGNPLYLPGWIILGGLGLVWLVFVLIHVVRKYTKGLARR
jgi:4-amino-4-deoxy-L-arabinose transferase-like glycosyltransferase